MRLIALSVVFGVIILFQSCTDHFSGNTYIHQFQNNSGHRVSVVIEDGLNLPAPDSLVIADGDIYQWDNGEDGNFYPFDVEGIIKVYYDNDVKVIFTGEQPRDPRNYSTYQLHKIGKNHELVIYTFTVADYEQAVMHNEI